MLVHQRVIPVIGCGGAIILQPPSDAHFYHETRPLTPHVCAFLLTTPLVLIARSWGINGRIEKFEEHKWQVVEDSLCPHHRTWWWAITSMYRDAIVLQYMCFQMFSWFFIMQSNIIPTFLQRLQHLSGHISFHYISLCSSVLDLGSLVNHLHCQQACLLPSCIPQSPFVCRGRWWRAFAQASFSGLSCPGCHGNQQAHLTLEITFTIVTMSMMPASHRSHAVLPSWSKR